MAALQAFGTKYGLALSEALSRRIRLHHIFHEDFEVEAFRNLLGVPDSKLPRFGNLRQKAIDPAITEVIKLAPVSFTLSSCKRVGRKVTK
ncbi:MAG: replication initiation protein, partial [Pseudomonadota bacterium]|nr:replication initiation protein [Pseudomonadota bacterium]